jgi:Fe-S-cluster containining protein
VKRILELRAKVPEFRCLAGCHDCCGPVPWTGAEWSQIKDKRQADSLDCPYIENGGCAIYQDRPFLCRLFGAVERGRMKCPHGCGPEYPLSEAQAHKLMEQYLSLF